MVRNIELQNTFSGPLDLLLYLVKRDEIDIHDIPVGHVTREYLNELEKMQDIDVDAGGEFLAMASMLTEIKGRMLLPDIQEDEDEDEEIYDPRQGLVEALLEYKKFKEVAAELELMSNEFDNRYSRNVSEPEFQAVVREKAEELGALDLLAAFQRIARKMLNERAPREIVSEEVPTEIRIQQIEEVVALRGRVSFSSILSDSPSEDEMVGFFIAMLELIRMRKISAQQAIDFSEIYFIPLDEELEAVEAAIGAAQKIELEEAVEAAVKIYPRSNCLCLSDPLSAGVKKKIVKTLSTGKVQHFDILSWKRGTEIMPSVKKVQATITGFTPLLRGTANKNGVILDKNDSVKTEPEKVQINSVVGISEPVIGLYRGNFKLSNIFAFRKFSEPLKQQRVELNRFDFLFLRRSPVMKKSELMCSRPSLAFPPALRGSANKYVFAAKEVIPDKMDLITEAADSDAAVRDKFVYIRRAALKVSSIFASTYRHQNMDIAVERVPSMFNTLNFKRKRTDSMKLRVSKEYGFMRLVTGRICKNAFETIALSGKAVVKSLHAETLAEKTGIVSDRTYMMTRSLCSLSDIFNIKSQVSRGKTASEDTNRVRMGGDFLRLKGSLKTVAATGVRGGKLEFLALAGVRGVLKHQTMAVSVNVVAEESEADVDSRVKMKRIVKAGIRQGVVLSSPFRLVSCTTAIKGNVSVKSEVIVNKFDTLRLVHGAVTAGGPVIHCCRSNKFLTLVSGRIVREQYTDNVIISAKKNVAVKHKGAEFQAGVLWSGERGVCSLSSIFSSKRSVITKGITVRGTGGNKFDMLARSYRKEKVMQLPEKKRQGFLSLYSGGIIAHSEKFTDVAAPVKAEESEVMLEEKTSAAAAGGYIYTTFSMSSVFAGSKKQMNSAGEAARKFDFMASSKPLYNKSASSGSSKFLKL